MATRGVLKAILAQQVGDALTTGSPAYLQGSGFKWAQPAYNSAISFAVEILREMFLQPTHSVIRWPVNATIYELTPASLVYVYEVIRENSLGSGLYETYIPMDIISVNRNTAGTALLHVDKTEADRRGLNLGSAQVLLKGYTYVADPTADTDTISMPSHQVTQFAKIFLHQAGAGRDPNELLKGLRQVEQARELVADFVGRSQGYIEQPGGIWLDVI